MTPATLILALALGPTPRPAANVPLLPPPEAGMKWDYARVAVVKDDSTTAVWFMPVQEETWQTWSEKNLPWISTTGVGILTGLIFGLRKIMSSMREAKDKRER